ncbi:Odorant receptor 67 [Frankliniella occidentalis]|uniref:Uncharacterized protein LOC113212776 isoform X1 n=1 Tax=Frankliniella occidentalis TaxID=133901 RepID=A0A6J1T2A5_FRAOC|nr:uncharacterized protein LOC113212776 isoform X1 [Frankliniella occidentalis]XP_052122090.1 uncharacterized protein LOC113212776 isoform X1 [Frankliniella occidentalis]KAE8748431.1 Odorant receptor 67 [Frankliniella occidentalis]
MKSKPLTTFILSLLDDISPGKNDTHWRRLKFSLRGNWVSLVASVITLFLELSAVTVPGSIPHDQVPVHVSLLLGVYSCIFAQVYLVRRVHLLQRCLALIASAASRVEEHVDAESQRAMLRTVRRGPRMRRFFNMCGAATEVLVVFSLFSTPPRWGESQDRVWLHYAILLMETYATSCCLNAFYTVIVYLLNVCRACADLHVALARRLETGHATSTCASVQGVVLNATLVLNAATSDLLPHLLFGVVGVPLISTVEVVSSGNLQDIYAVGTAPLLLTLFVPICLTGERLGEARREVAFRAALGPWLEELPVVRRLRLGILVAAEGRGAQLRGSGIGLLDKPACLQALKSWFSFVQMMLNLRDKA